MTAQLIFGSIHATNHLGGNVLIYASLFVLWGLIGLIPLLSKEPTSERYKTPPIVQRWTVVATAAERPNLAQLIADEGRTIDGNIREVNEPRLLSENGRWGR